MRGINLLIFSVLFFYGPLARSQSVQWASEVVGVSAEARGETYSQQYRANQALGKPSQLPQALNTPCAWMPTRTESAGDEWIRVRFATAQRIRQVVVLEAGNPGAVTQISVFDAAGNEHIIFHPADRDGGPGKPRAEAMLRVMPMDSMLTGREIKVVLNPARTAGPNQIDAIGISASVQPIMPTINVSKDAPKDVLKENLGKTINTAGQEVAPVIAPDGKTLYFTRCFHKDNIGSPDRQDVWFSTLGPDGTWQDAANLGQPINNAGDNAIGSLSVDGRSMYLLNVYLPTGGQTYGFSKSLRTKTGWSTPTELRVKNIAQLPRKDDEQVVETEFTVAGDGNTMVLSVRRRNSIGDRDLYVSFRQPDQSWSEPKHLGMTVNTADFESAPFLAADSRTLYFTSGGLPGYGRGDIFVTRRQDETWTNWSEPENLGPAINTGEWDGYFTIPASGEYAYLSSRANSLGEDDIFRVRLFPAIKPEPVAIVSGQVLDALTKKPVPAEVLLRVVGDTTVLSRAEYDPETGEYKVALALQKNYTLVASKTGYLPLTESLDLRADKKYREIKRNLLLSPVASGKAMVLKEVIFEQSQSTLLPSAGQELDRLAALMQERPTMRVLIEGHTDNIGDWGLNVKLSQDRVEVVKAYLVAKGIVPTRVETKAWGPSRPIANNVSEDRRKLNRRVELTILSM
jgi:outer membrane protein OmpA-like peptidoglycan-associated protein